MLGEIALWSFVVLLLTGTLLTLWYKPGMGETVYNGSYDQLRGVTMSEAYASTLNISFDIRGACWPASRGTTGPAPAVRRGDARGPTRVASPAPSASPVS